MSEYLFHDNVLKNLDDTLDDLKNHNLDSNLLLRPLSVKDYNKGFLNILQQLTVVGDVNEATFIEKFNLMKSCKEHYYVIVLEDLNSGQIVASATLAIQEKFIHQCSKKGVVEDVVVSSEYRKKNIGKLLVSTLVKLAKTLGCYKVVLDCRDHVISFYESLGFKREQNHANYLQRRLVN